MASSLSLDARIADVAGSGVADPDEFVGLFMITGRPALIAGQQSCLVKWIVGEWRNKMASRSSRRNVFSAKNEIADRGA